MNENQAFFCNKPNRTIVYIDGFNLYFGLKSEQWKRYYWLDLKELSHRLLKPYQKLSSIKYFTSRVVSTPHNSEKHKRQQTYLEALETLDLCTIYYGHYLKKTVNCNKCGKTWDTFEEKMTDVNIGVEMLNDAYCDHFDTALLISGDSDLVGPLIKIKEHFKEKRIVVAFPPNRISKQLKQIANGYFTIGRKMFSESQFPEKVTKNDEFILTRPEKWK